jgi:hypothetical protein
MRTMASLGHYLVTTSGDSLYLHQLTGSRITAGLAGDVLSLEVTTDYPWSGSARLAIEAAPSAECGLAIRVPGWCDDVRVSLNGEPLTVAQDGRGYLLVRRRWQPGDVLSWELDLQVPRELVDAAKVDGASVLRTLVSVFRPLIMPGIATAALYAFLFSWTEILGALSFLTNDSLFTLPVALSNVETGTYGAVNYGLLLAGAVIAMIPCIIVYVALQRFYVRGPVSGALKG